jgi:signal transduction histidine kinase
MRRNPLGGLTIKAALTIGFSLTLGLWLFTGYRLTQRVTASERTWADIAARYVQAQDRLATLRAQTLAASGTARDALLDRTQHSLEVSRRLLEQRLGDLETTLGQYVLVMASPDEETLRIHLAEEMGRFAASLRDAMALPAASRGDGPVRFRDEVLPRRTALLEAADRLQARNRSAFVAFQTGLSEAGSAAERTSHLQLGFALFCGLCIAVVATVYAGRLEKRLVSQLVQDALKTKALQELSIKMIRAQEDERRRIARELHDEVGQALTAIKVELALADRIAAVSATASLKNAHGLTEDALRTVRDLSHLLHPSVLDDLGLPEAVEGYLREFSKRHEIKTRLQVEGMAARLPSDVEVAAYRIIQEALTNVARHARATECTVTMRRRYDRCHIIVEDDGLGFEPGLLEGPGYRRGLGLIGMRERALQLAGMVSIQSTPGRGTRVAIDLPARLETEGRIEPSAPGARAAEAT